MGRGVVLKQHLTSFSGGYVLSRDKTSYCMAESVFAMRLVNLRSVTCYTDQNFNENAHFGALNLFTTEKKVEIKLQDVYQP